jgi:hypothetical protein
MPCLDTLDISGNRHTQAVYRVIGRGARGWRICRGMQWEGLWTHRVLQNAVTEAFGAGEWITGAEVKGVEEPWPRFDIVDLEGCEMAVRALLREFKLGGRWTTREAREGVVPIVSFRCFGWIELMWCRNSRRTRLSALSYRSRIPLLSEHMVDFQANQIRDPACVDGAEHRTLRTTLRTLKLGVRRRHHLSRYTSNISRR